MKVEYLNRQQIRKIGRNVPKEKNIFRKKKDLYIDMKSGNRIVITNDKKRGFFALYLRLTNRGLNVSAVGKTIPKAIKNVLNKVSSHVGK